MADNKIDILADGKLLVPDHVEVPFITGDGIGVEIMPAMQQVIDSALKATYKGKKTNFMEGSGCWATCL